MKRKQASDPSDPSSSPNALPKRQRVFIREASPSEEGDEGDQVQVDMSGPEYAFMLDPRLTDKEKTRKARAIRNRASAQASRNRKKTYLEDLEFSIQELQRENAAQRLMLAQLKGNKSGISSGSEADPAIGMVYPPSPSLSSNTINSVSTIVPSAIQTSPLTNTPELPHEVSGNQALAAGCSMATPQILLDNIQLQAKVQKLEDLVKALLSVSGFGISSVENSLEVNRAQTTFTGASSGASDGISPLPFGATVPPATLVHPLSDPPSILAASYPTKLFSAPASSSSYILPSVPSSYLTESTKSNPSNSHDLARHPAAMATPPQWALQRASSQFPIIQLIGRESKGIQSGSKAESLCEDKTEGKEIRDWMESLVTNRKRVEDWRRKSSWIGRYSKGCSPSMTPSPISLPISVA